jgi:hypothetical protein
MAVLPMAAPPDPAPAIATYEVGLFAGSRDSDAGAIVSGCANRELDSRWPFGARIERHLTRSSHILLRVLRLRGAAGGWTCGPLHRAAGPVAQDAGAWTHVDTGAAGTDALRYTRVGRTSQLWFARNRIGCEACFAWFSHGADSASLGRAQARRRSSRGATVRST